MKDSTNQSVGNVSSKKNLIYHPLET
jgi:hypothetical protein